MVAESLLKGDGLTFAYQQESDELSDQVIYTPAVLHMPGYTFLMAGTWRIFNSQNYVFIQFLQVILDVLCCFILYKIAGELYNLRVGLIAAGLYAVHWPVIRIEGIRTNINKYRLSPP